MSTVTSAKAPALLGPCLLPWCTSDHARTRSWLDHGSEHIRDGRMYARITWAQPLDRVAKHADAGVRVYLKVSEAKLHLPVRGLADLSILLRESGAVDVAEFVGRVIAVAAGEDGAK